MTKDQEREVLRQIIKLIDSTEDGSYIKTAFQGCVADADENIENDFALSWYDRAQSAERKAEEAQAVAKDAREAYEALKATAAQKNKYIEYWKGETEAAGRENAELTKEAEAAKAEADALRHEVIELKAKLYDFMAKG